MKHTPAAIEKDLSVILANARQYPELTKAVRFVIKRAALQIKKETIAKHKPK